MNYSKGDLLYEGKGKKVFRVQEQPDLLWLEFKDQLTAFNAQKKGEFSGKGEINCAVASFIFRYLNQVPIKNHWVSDLAPKEMLVKKLKMIPLEVVVRNRMAGSLAKKLNRTEGEIFKQPIVEFYFKDDALGDPFINDDQALLLEAVHSYESLNHLRRQALVINEQLKKLFSCIGIDLVDFKIEFGWTTNGEIILADEITPDSCRLWDQKSGEKLDKDRFRRDLGQVKESYQEVYDRIQKYWGPKL